MDEAIRDILQALRANEALDAAQLDRIVRKHSRRAHDGRRLFAKKRLLPYYLEQKRAKSPVWESWNVNDELDARLMRTLQMKPRRTASGVATVTVITKPWPCSNDCIYCPNDERMPKSYLSDEPACQRAERNRFNPYLQVASRLHTLEQMGHSTGKVELIVLGGTWMDYPRDYRLWFVAELYRALDDSDAQRAQALSALESGEVPGEHAVDAGMLEALQRVNEGCEHRMVGLVVETRPDTVTADALSEMRMLGCTKIQLGVQSVDAGLLRANGRCETPETIAESLSLARLFGFKTHVHFMLNLLGATPEGDVEDYRTLVDDPSYRPDEVKLYPCALVAGTGLSACYERGEWHPYGEDELVGALCECMKATPPFVRVSRMIRDISAKDIVAGNKKTNLRQIVDEKLAGEGAKVCEIRYREIATGAVEPVALTLDEVAYDTASTGERFLQWVTPDYKIAGFLRLSFPRREAVSEQRGLPVEPGEAMIREVHVYGVATRVGDEGASAQHRGLGRKLIERACAIAADAGYCAMNVISAVGTREYYRSLGFVDNGLYLRKPLNGRAPE